MYRFYAIYARTAFLCCQGCLSIWFFSSSSWHISNGLSAAHSLCVACCICYQGATSLGPFATGIISQTPSPFSPLCEFSHWLQWSNISYFGFCWLYCLSWVKWHNQQTQKKLSIEHKTFLMFFGQAMVPIYLFKQGFDWISCLWEVWLLARVQSHGVPCWLLFWFCLLSVFMSVPGKKSESLFVTPGSTIMPRGIGSQ